MATVHPSRLAHIPQAFREPQRAHSPPLPPRRSRSRSRDRDRDHARSSEHDRREQERGREGGGRDYSRERERNERDRRGSPKYDEYSRLSPPPEARDAPWRVQENMYPPRRGERGGGVHANGYAQRGGDGDFFEGRRRQRESSTLSVWPPSPKAPARDISPERRSRSHKKSGKRGRSLSITASSSSEDDEDRRRRERKEKKRARREKDKDKDRRKRRSKSLRSEDEDEYDQQKDRDKRRRSENRSRSRHRRSSERDRARSPSPDEDAWVEKPAAAIAMPPPPVPAKTVATNGAPATTASTSAAQPDVNDSDDEVGPQPLMRTNTSSKRVDERAYGGALLRGEGSAMAAFLQDGTDSRIPRRGEIGLTSDEIASYENVGFVMSGSRHRRMNAVRMRKENQVISAEEKRGILKLQKEERERREAILREEFQELVQEKLKGAPGKNK